LVLELTHLHPGVSLAQARAATGWDLAVSADLATTEPPTAAELEVLRHLNAKQAGSPEGRRSS
jgi:glutaconate CoA-transferase subunit B